MLRKTRSTGRIAYPRETAMQAIDDVLQHMTSDRAVPGIVAMAAISTDIVYANAFGVRDLSKPDAMTQDSVFWIASMTKAITSIAAMQLVERGRLSLDASIGDVLPDFAALQVLERIAADGAPILRPARAPATLRQLLTHTAGFCYDMWNGTMAAYLAHTQLPRTGSGKRVSLGMPLAFDPGTRWEYGINTDIVGLLVEAASGRRLDRYLADNIFAPLGMADTAFKITPSMRERLVRVHRRQPDGVLVPIDFECVQEPEQHMGGGGLYSTAPDYIRFVQMILNKGFGNNQRIVSAETIAAMTRNQIGDLAMTRLPSSLAQFTNDVDFFPGIEKKWGLGFMINTAQTPEGRSAGSLAWAGLANTYYWIDPARDIAGVILMQVLPFADQTCLETFAAFERGVYAALDRNSRAA
jgi:CubicO group peptidase (beta-lactamase class C family)